MANTATPTRSGPVGVEAAFGAADPGVPAVVPPLFEVAGRFDLGEAPVLRKVVCGIRSGHARRPAAGMLGVLVGLRCGSLRVTVSVGDVMGFPPRCVSAGPDACTWFAPGRCRGRRAGVEVPTSGAGLRDGRLPSRMKEPAGRPVSGWVPARAGLVRT